MTYKLLSFFTISILFFACNDNKASKPINTNLYVTEVTVLADSLLKDSKINAVSIGIYKDGKKNIFHFGELDPDQNNTPTDTTIYEIASVSKVFTGALVAKAVLDKKINLDVDITNYLEEEFKNFNYKDSPVTIRHLLTHTSGLPKFLPESVNTLFTEFNESLPFRMDSTLQLYSKSAFLKDLHKFRLDTIPGYNYSYSNVDTELMALILENVYDSSFENILTDFYKRIGMTTTKIILDSEESKFLARGYGMTGKVVPSESIPLYGADGGIKTTLPDILNFMEFLLNGTNEVAQETLRPLLARKTSKLAYYWPIKYDEELGAYYRQHGGGYGTQNWLYIIPKYKIGISVITNQSDLDTANKLLVVVNNLIESLKK